MFWRAAHAVVRNAGVHRAVGTGMSNDLRKLPRSHLPALALAAVLAGVAPRALAEQVHVDVVRRGDTTVIEASAMLAADVAGAWQVLTDYERYADFIPGVQSSRIVARNGPAVVVEQTDQLPLWPWRVPVRVTYAIDESPPRELDSHATSDAFPTLESRYVLIPAASGVALRYVGTVRTPLPLIGGVERWIAVRAVTRDLQALADEIEHRAATVSE